LDRYEVERIARRALKELGAPSTEFTLSPIEGHPGQWRMDVQGPRGPGTLKIRCGDGTTAQWVREQIFDQYNALQ
jgi:hypothetical protein